MMLRRPTASLTHELTGSPARRRHRVGFTLLEVLAVAVITAMLFTVMINMYLDLSRASQRAGERTRLDRHADAVFDHIARDLQEAILITKPPELDPLKHPWFFIGDENSFGSRVMFFTRNQKARGSRAREWDMSKVAFFMEPDGDGRLALWRWNRPGVPAAPLFEFPDPDSEGVALLSDRIESFFLEYVTNDEEEWVSEWDSVQIERSSTLPKAARVELTISDPNYAGDEPDGELRVFERIILLQVPPLDSAHLFSTRNEGEIEDSELCLERGEGLDVADCVDRSHPGFSEADGYIFGEIPKAGCFYDFIGELQDIDPSLIDTQNLSECRVVMSNWEEDQR